jgi:hypothetical protein
VFDDVGCDINTVNKVNASAGEEVCINKGPAKNPRLSLVTKGEDIPLTVSYFMVPDTVST